ncbi:hypothetical protein PENSTE_c007G08636 [Penicillium steckii]|uniref:Uncharacterized protein n=1 Tax=Penicillium steckii TaxID=303698 RepID=A0A1V6TEF7_9EURO|nr:hypothetical protein PENSTE_c007G08636 [Penicillium steckii]
MDPALDCRPSWHRGPIFVPPYFGLFHGNKQPPHPRFQSRIGSRPASGRSACRRVGKQTLFPGKPNPAVRSRRVLFTPHLLRLLACWTTSHLHPGVKPLANRPARRYGQCSTAKCQGPKLPSMRQLLSAED